MDERGASAVEYGLLIAGIAALIVVVVFAFGGNLKAHLHGHLQRGRRQRRRQRLLIAATPHDGASRHTPRRPVTSRTSRTPR